MSKREDLDQRKSKLSLAKKALLEKRLRRQLVKDERVHVYARRPADAPALLSFAQQRLWFIDQIDSTNTSYNVLQAIRISGSLNIALLEQTFNEIVRRHEILRSSFQVIDGLLLQVAEPSMVIHI